MNFNSKKRQTIYIKNQIFYKCSLFLIFYSYYYIFYFSIIDLQRMILQNIEKLAEKTVQSIGNQENKNTMKAILQACYYNLNNLKQSFKEGNRSKLPSLQKASSKYSKENDKQNDIYNILSISNVNISKDDSSKMVSFISSRNKPQLSVPILKHQNNLHISFPNKTLTKDQMIKLASKQLSSSKEKQLISKKQKKTVSFRKKIKLKAKNLQNFLKKQQRYHEQMDVIVQEDVVDKIGLYDATNIFKAKNVSNFIENVYKKKLEPVINLRFTSLGACSKDKLFLTQNSDFPEFNPDDSYSQFISTFDHQKKIRENFKISEVIKEKYTQQALYESEEKKEKQEKQQKRLHIQDSHISKSSNSKTKQTSQIQDWTVTIHNYQIVKNEQFYYFKCKHIQDWNELSFILHQITKYIKTIKVAHVSFKLQKDLFLKELWSSKKIKFCKIEELLKLKSNIKNIERKKNQELRKPNKRVFNSREEVIREIISLWRDRKNLQIKKKSIKKRKQVLIRLALRMIVKYRVRKNIKKKMERVKELNTKLCDGVWHPDVQIYLPSFSQEEFIRNSTQYMQNYQNMFYHIWSSSSKHIILIMPAINQNLLKIFQRKMKIRKNITIICPDSHDIYPKNLPLAAYLLYSKESIQRIKGILYNRRGIIIPGCFNQKYPIIKENNILQYELNLSDLLMIPIYTNLTHFNMNKTLTNLKDQQNILSTYNVLELQKFNINIPITIKLSPNSSKDQLIKHLAQIIVNNPNVKVWLFKLNGQFNGRGIALFDASSSKKLKDILLCDKNNPTTQKNIRTTKSDSKIISRLKYQLKLKIIQYLQTYFRLKLKVNFENCIYRVQQYIQKFLKNGGIIQEYFQDCETFELCFRNQAKNFNHCTNRLEEQKIRLLATSKNYCIDFINRVSLFNYAADMTYSKEKDLNQFEGRIFQFLKEKYFIGYISVVGVFCNLTQKMYAIQFKPYLTQNSCLAQYICWKQIKNSRKLEEKNSGLDRTSFQYNDNEINFQKSYRAHQKQDSSNMNEQSENKIIKTHFTEEKIHLFIPSVIFTDVDEVSRSQIIENKIIEEEQEQEQHRYEVEKFRKTQYNFENCMKNLEFNGITTQNLSLGLTLSLLFSGEVSQLRKIKKKAIEQLRSLSERMEGSKIYRGKQQIRDVFRFGDVIRAISKIK